MLTLSVRWGSYTRCLETEDRLHYGPFVCCIIGPTIGPVKFMILTGTRRERERERGVGRSGRRGREEKSATVNCQARGKGEEAADADNLRYGLLFFRPNENLRRRLSGHLPRPLPIKCGKWAWCWLLPCHLN